MYRILTLASKVGLPIVAGVFIASAVLKSMDPYETLRTMRYLVVFDFEALAKLSVVGLICVEWATACLLLWPRTKKIGAMLTCILGFLFFATVALLVLADAPVGCGCGIGPSKEVSWVSISRPGILLAIGAAGFTFMSKNTEDTTTDQFELKAALNPEQ